MMPSSRTMLGTVAVISLERWDEVWRRNQHLAARLPALGLADHVTFVNPAAWSGSAQCSPVPGVTVMSPHRRAPKRLGGLRAVARSLSRGAAGKCDTLWVNDPTTGAFLSDHAHVVYDITDDWRSACLHPRERHRLIAAEDVLARRARTVVCSDELQRRWHSRYGLKPDIVRNAADVAAIRHAQPRTLAGSGPHVGYVGTLHEERLDVDLVIRTADDLAAGRVHLVGPDCLSEGTRSRLTANPRITVHGRVPVCDVPSWLVAFDVLISPHVVTGFTLSLDAIKAYEYLATSRPVVATPTSGFQEHSQPGLQVRAVGFPEAVRLAARRGGTFERSVPDWDDRARQFANALRADGRD